MKNLIQALLLTFNLNSFFGYRQLKLAPIPVRSYGDKPWERRR